MNLLKFATAGALFLSLAPTTSRAMDPSLYLLDKPLGAMMIDTPVAAISARASLLQSIWGATSPFSIMPDPSLVRDGNCCNGEMAPTYFGRTPASTTWMTIRLNGAANLYARVFYAKFAGSNCVAVINGGHSQGYFNKDNLPNFNIPGVDALVGRLAAKPCDIVLSSMPVMGENRLFASHIGANPDTLQAHAQVGAITPATGSSLRYFLDPAIIGLNYALAQKPYSQVIEIGISGGGWTTTMLAAIDARISKSYAVAGSVPLAFRAALPEGDWEQYNVPADYLDLYAMSVAEAGRRSFLIYNGHDACCFKSEAVTPWATALIGRLSSFPGKFGVLMQYPQSQHDISVPMADFIMNDLDQ